MSVIGVIPARYQATRLPFKLLRKLFGKSLLQWTWESACRATLLDRVIIACDDPKLEGIAKEFGGKVVPTSVQHLCGTDRIAEAVRDMDVSVVVNIQADEPLIHPSTIDGLVQEMVNSSNLVMATPKKRIDDDNEISNPNVVKVVCDKDDFALYFSRFPIPYYRESDISKVYYKHIGIYAYTKDFLYTYEITISSSR
ncbi:MAG: 3-deoxy-manno-octulosonate cytidylyltransferase, partial [Candidatus Omnitrophota bacterium]